MLVEKYRPKKLEEVVGQNDNIAVIQELLNNGGIIEMPHLLFHGPPGTGKTTTALAIAEETGADYVEFNASDNRKIEDVRNHIIPAMQYMINKRGKIIFLDEGDQLTHQAQEALRRPLERYANCTVIVSANNPGKLKMALHSRVMEFEFGGVPETAIEERLEHVANKENFDNVNIKQIVEECNGDLRKAINLLQQYEYKGDEYKELVEKYNGD